MINFLSKAPQLVDKHVIELAAAIEASIVNHCRANMHFGMDANRHDTLDAVEKVAADRYDVLMEMLT